MLAWELAWESRSRCLAHNFVETLPPACLAAPPHTPSLCGIRQPSGNGL